MSFEGIPAGAHEALPDNRDLIRDAAGNAGTQLGEALAAAEGFQRASLAVGELRRAWVALRAACEQEGA
jgi:hypothetical protein